MNPIDLQLLKACVEGDLHTAQALLQQGANPNTRDPWGQTLFLIATPKGDINMLRLLIEHGADPCLADPFGKNALHHAVENGHHDIAEYLLSELKITPNTQNQRGITPLMIAARNGDIHMLRLLIQHGADPNIADGDQRTALHYAVERGDYPIAEFLLSQIQTDPNTQDRDGITPLMIATQNGDIDMLKILIQHGANPYAIDHEDRTALYYAVEKQHHDIAQYLLSQFQLDPNHLSRWKDPLFIIAAKNGDIKMLQLLAQHGANPHIQGAWKKTALHHAVENQYHDIAQYLLTQLNLDPNTQDHDGRTPLILAAKNGDIPMLRLLIQHGADPTITDDDQRTALHHAAGKGRYETVQYLIIHLDLDPDTEDHDGTTPFMIASSKGDIPMLRLLTQLGANPHATDHQGRNTLHYVAKYGGSETGLCLITHYHLDPNQQDHDGNTPLLIATKHQNSFIAQTLIRLGANPHIPNHQGQTPSAIARLRPIPLGKPKPSSITL